MSREMLKAALSTKEASVLASLRGVLKRALGLAPSIERAAINSSTSQGLANEALKSAIGTSTKKNLATATGGSLRRAAGAGLGSGSALAALEAAGVENQPLLWGLVGSAGVLGHDLAGALTSRSGKGYAKHLQKISCARRDKKILLQKLGKCSKGRKKKAGMIKEGPHREERSLTKEANFLKLLKNISKQKKLEEGLGLGLGAVGLGLGGAGSYGLAHAIAPGTFTRHALLETTPLFAGGMALGGLGAVGLGRGLGKGVNYIRNPKAYRARNTLTEALSNLTKTSSLSRTAKGAIAAPLGVMGAAAIHPELFGHHVGEVMSHSDTIGSRILGSLDNISRSAVGDLGLKGTGNILASLGGLGTLGAGAGKLSEKVVPLAKNNPMSKLLENPKYRKILIAAGLFPWVPTAAGVAYLVNKAKGSDS